MAEVDRNDLLRAVQVLADGLGDVEALQKARVSDYRAKRARIDLLIAEGRCEEVDDGGVTLLRYHLTHLVRDKANQKIEFLTFRRPTVKTIRSAARFAGDEWSSHMIKTLSHEIADDETLGRIDGSEWDDIVEVVQFPFAVVPSHVGEKITEAPASSGGTS